VLDTYTHSSLVYYKHNGDDEPYAPLYAKIQCFSRREDCSFSFWGLLLSLTITKVLVRSLAGVKLRNVEIRVV